MNIIVLIPIVIIVIIIDIIIFIVVIRSHVGSSVLGAAQECARIANLPAHHGCRARGVSALGLDREEDFPPTPAVAANMSKDGHKCRSTTSCR